MAPSERARPALYSLSLLIIQCRVSYAVIKWWMSNDDRSGHILASLLILPANNTSYITPKLVKLQTGHTESHSLLLLETINCVECCGDQTLSPHTPSVCCQWSESLPDSQMLTDVCLVPPLVTDISDQSRMKLYVRVSSWSDGSNGAHSIIMSPKCVRCGNFYIPIGHTSSSTPDDYSHYIDYKLPRSHWSPEPYKNSCRQN